MCRHILCDLSGLSAQILCPPSSWGPSSRAHHSWFKVSQKGHRAVSGECVPGSGLGTEGAKATTQPSCSHLYKVLGAFFF